MTPITDALADLTAGELRTAFMFLFAVSDAPQGDALKVIQAAKDVWAMAKSNHPGGGKTESK